MKTSDRVLKHFRPCVSPHAHQPVSAAGPTGGETLKNLVLGGIGSFTVVDAGAVCPRDLGNNFLVRRCVIVSIRLFHQGDHRREAASARQGGALRHCAAAQASLRVAPQVEASDVGQKRAAAVTAALKELNENVAGSFVEEDPGALLAARPAFFRAFSLVIATQVHPWPVRCGGCAPKVLFQANS